MEWVEDLTLHVDALLSAIESDKKFFAPVAHYVKELQRLLRQPSALATKSALVTPARKIKEFWDRYKPSQGGDFYIPPAQTSNTASIVDEIYNLITRLTALPDDQFVASLRGSQFNGPTASPSSRPAESDLERLQSFRTALDDQDAILVEAATAAPKYQVPIPQVSAIGRIFDEIRAEIPDLIAEFEGHGHPSAVRAQIRGARSRLQRLIDTLERDGAVETSGNTRATGEVAASSASAMKIFISHSSEDVAVAEALADLLRNALHLPATEIRCSSVLAYALPYAAETAKALKAEVIEAPVFIGIITPSSVESSWVLFELGARWGRDRYLVPLLAGGALYDMLPPPIRNLNAAICKSEDAIIKLIEEVGKTLQRPNPSLATYRKYVTNLITEDAALAAKNDLRSTRIPSS